MRVVSVGPRIAAVVLAMLGCGSAARAVNIPPEKVDQAIAKAKAWLYSQQKSDGRWETDPQRHGDAHDTLMQGDMWGGYTALATYALLASGESPSDPRIKSAVEFLKNAELIGVYAVAMRCQVWLLIPHQSAEIKALIRKDADFLFKGINDGKLNPQNKGLWDYLGKGDRVDHSVSQYGILGLWACQQAGAGVDVGAQRWQLFESAWKSHQQEDGGWAYSAVRDGQSPAMTAAGVATLFIINDYLHAEDGVSCRGNVLDPAIDKGLNWIDKNYDMLRDNYYAYYGMERIGTASGYKYFAGHDWYNDLANRLLESQEINGSWLRGGYPASSPLDETSFALLFLSRGRAPVMFNKLDYRQPGQPIALWNERPRDLANLTQWVGHEMEVFLNFQIVSLAASPEDLHDAPVLYVTGGSEFTLTPQDTQKIKTFIEQGGMVLANADCDRPAFANSVIALGKSMFGRDFRPLPGNHPAFTHEQYPASRWRKPIKVLGLSNGVRELMMLVPEGDPARWWQVPAGSLAHQDAFELGADLFQYAVDRKPWSKGITFVVQPDPKIKAERRIKLARLDVGSNWDPEPGGWPRISALLHNQDRLDLTVFNAVPGQGALAAAQVAQLTGTTDFTLSDPARLELKTFVTNGGTLIVDAAGGAPAFADAAQRELDKTFGAGAVDVPLPSSSQVYYMAGHPIQTFSYRKWAHDKEHSAMKDPRLRGMPVGNRIGVFFSREDLSAGIVGEPVDGILGYSPDTATEIMRNVILYVAEGQPRVAAQATQPGTGPVKADPAPTGRRPRAGR